jgi:hypothetical protein
MSMSTFPAATFQFPIQLRSLFHPATVGIPAATPRDLQGRCMLALMVPATADLMYLDRAQAVHRLPRPKRRAVASADVRMDRKSHARHGETSSQETTVQIPQRLHTLSILPAQDLLSLTMRNVSLSSKIYITIEMPPWLKLHCMSQFGYTHMKELSVYWWVKQPPSEWKAIWRL